MRKNSAPTKSEKYAGEKYQIFLKKITASSLLLFYVLVFTFGNVLATKSAHIAFADEVTDESLPMVVTETPTEVTAGPGEETQTQTQTQTEIQTGTDTETSTSTQEEQPAPVAQQSVQTNLIQEENTATSTASSSAEQTEQKVMVHVRYNNDIVFERQVTIAQRDIDVIDNASVVRKIQGSSTLAAIIEADKLSDNFELTDLSYFDSFDSYIINCLNIQTQNIATSTTVNACYNWQFVVNDTYPFVGVDDYILHDGDDVYLYFGTKSRIVLPTETAYTTIPFLVRAENYEYRTNAWSPLAGVTVGATRPDPSNPWSPEIVNATTTSSDGYASLTVATSGAYGIGISEEYYYPLYDFAVVDISEAPEGYLATSTATSTTDMSGTGNNSGGAGQGSGVIGNQFSVENAISFILTKENGGAYTSALYADWAAIAFASYGGIGGIGTNPVKNYLINNQINSSNPLDYARRAMSLMSLGVNPYNGTSKNYIEQIKKSFDGNQFGSTELVNDDIFSVLVLSKAGYTTSDPEISKSISYILSKQQSSGAFESVDVTAAAISVLAPFANETNVSSALARAKQYLKSTQESDGGWQNTFATAWVMQAISALGESPRNWTVSGKNPNDYLGAKQSTNDGGLESSLDNNSRLWATSYAVPGYLGKTWGSIMVPFAKKTGTNESANSANNGVEAGVQNSSNGTGTSSPSSATTTASTSPSLFNGNAQTGASTTTPLRTTGTRGSEVSGQFDTAGVNSESNNRQLARTSDQRDGSNLNQGVGPQSSDLVERGDATGLGQINQIAESSSILDFIARNSAAKALLFIMFLALLGLGYIGYNKSRN